MFHNFSANRLNDYAVFYDQVTQTDDYGKPTQVDEFSFDCRCEVDVKSGSQLVNMGKASTDTTVTLLTYFHQQVSSAQVVVWNDDRYQVEHIQPDKMKKSMIVTASYIGEQSF